MGKTITKYLIDGNPQGVQNIFLSNNICSLTVIPLSELSKMYTRKELQNPALYILIGDDEGNLSLKLISVKPKTLLKGLKTMKLRNHFGKHEKGQT